MKKEEGNRKEKDISCSEFTYVIFHGFLWGVEFLMVGTATCGVNQPEREQVNLNLLPERTPLNSRRLQNDKQTEAVRKNSTQQRTQLKVHANGMFSVLGKHDPKYLAKEAICCLTTFRTRAEALWFSHAVIP